jgi:glycosyltransferase involved in cell wall biosynthesis
MKEDFAAALATVIVTTFNRADLVTKGMDSVWGQSYRPIELIVVVDGATDNTQDVLERWRVARGGDSQFTTRIVFQENHGISAARNRGLIESRGEFIQLLDDDDLLGPEKLALQLKYMAAHPECDMTYGATFTIGDESRVPNRSNQPVDRETALRYLVRTHFFNNNCPVFRRRTCHRAGPWHEGSLIAEDYEYYARLLCLGITFAYVPEAEGFIQPYDGNRKRSSYGGEPHRQHDFYRSRFIHLDCLWGYLPDDLRKQASWRRAISKELLAVSKELLLLGDAGLGKKGVGLSREIGRGTSYMTLVRLMMTLVAVFGPQAGARVFATLQRRVGAIWRAIRGRKLTAV